MARVQDWIAGARPRTLPVALAAAFAGSAVAVHFDAFVWWKALLCAVTSVALQVGSNYANDYSDGIKGTDEVRVGPVRLVASGLATPQQVLRATIISLTVGAIAGIAIAVTSAWWLLLVGLACLAAAWLYTGGPKPYGYFGMGELMCFTFFGPVAAGGTAYVQLGGLNSETWLPTLAVGVGVGIMTASVMMANNLRDRPNDAQVGKITLAVMVGDRAARMIYFGFQMVALAALIVLAATTTWWALLGLIFLGPASECLKAVLGGATGRDLIEVLKKTGVAELLWALGAFVGVVIASQI